MLKTQVKPDNFKPEKWVEAQILAWAFQNRWQLWVFDSKAIEGKKSKIQSNPGLPVGTPDLGGLTDIGLSAFVELKAPGLDGVCRLGQRLFLERVIDSYGFGVVVSDAQTLENHYVTWLTLREQSLQEARSYLLEQLPRKVLVGRKVITIAR